MTVACRQCGAAVEEAREHYATPICFACLPPALPVMYVGASAVVSECGRYRYTLRRQWRGHPCRPEKIAVFVMLNPSTADAAKDDPTIRRCVSFARDWGCEEVEVVNLFAWRATSPTQLRIVDEPVGTDNDAYIATAIERARRTIGPVVVAWGAHAHEHSARVNRVLGILGRPVFALGVTARGEPRHPLYVRGNVMPQEWPVKP